MNANDISLLIRPFNITPDIVIENLTHAKLATMWFRILLIAAVVTLCDLPAEACSCAGANPNGCQVPVADMIVRATVVSQEVDQLRGPAFSGSPQRVARPAGAIMHPEPWGRVKVTLRVSEQFRGAAGDTAGPLWVRRYSPASLGPIWLGAGATDAGSDGHGKI
jgi:hypothetical protein